MIVEPRLVEYLNSLETELPEHLAALEAYAAEHDVPIIRKEAQSLLRFLLEVKRPARILEVGAAIGFSASFFCEYMPKGCTVTTIEKDPERILEAKKHFLTLRRASAVTLLEGDAQELLEKLCREGSTYDFVFMDAAKAQYRNYLVPILPMLEEGALLVTDNVLQEGSIVESRYGVFRRDRTIHTRMRDYLYELKHREQLVTSIVAVGDGMALSVVRRSTGD